MSVIIQTCICLISITHNHDNIFNVKSFVSLFIRKYMYMKLFNNNENTKYYYYSISISLETHKNIRRIECIIHNEEILTSLIDPIFRLIFS